MLITAHAALALDEVDAAVGDQVHAGVGARGQVSTPTTASILPRRSAIEKGFIT